MSDCPYTEFYPNCKSAEISRLQSELEQRDALLRECEAIINERGHELGWLAKTGTNLYVGLLSRINAVIEETK